MYSRSYSKDLRVPHNYGGNLFSSRPTPATPVEDLTHRRPSHEPPAPPPVTEDAPDTKEVCEVCEECEMCEQCKSCESCEKCESCERHDKPKACEKPPAPSILSPFGALGTEELLLLALALIVFQNGNTPDLALILIALLFL